MTQVKNPLLEKIQENEAAKFDFPVPTVAECAEAIGEPPEAWVSRCHEIACKLIEALQLPGKLQYGLYIGLIAEGSRFQSRPYARHGWVLLNDGRIFDPTRWCFDSPDDPYIFCVSEMYCGDDYDFGMNKLREAMRNPPPSVGDFGPGTEYADEKRERGVQLALDGVVRDTVQVLFEDASLPLQPPEPDNEGVLVLTNAQVFWLANTPLQLLGEAARPVFKAIVDSGQKYFIPLDNREAVGL